MLGKITKIRLLVSLLICFASFSIFPQASAEPSRSIFYVTNTQHMGAGSLYQAIDDALNNPGPDRIEFNIPVTDPNWNYDQDEFYIYVYDTLDLNDPDGVYIDGTTQPEQWADDNPEIFVLKMASPLGSVFEIMSSSKGNTLKGLYLQGGDGSANTLRIDGDYNLVIDNEFSSMGGGDGIYLSSAAEFNTIQENYIFANTQNGIRLVGSTKNDINNNVIGLTPSWYVFPDPNQQSGILCTTCSDNDILGNTISGNLKHGIEMSIASGNLISGNLVGLSEDGLEDEGNGEHGILLSDSCIGNEVFENWVSGNGKDGIHLNSTTTTNNHIEVNAVGFAFDASFIPNAEHGIGIYDGAHGNYVGKIDDLTRGNFIGGNGWSGVVIVNSSTGTNYLYGNNILFNQYYGVHVNASKDNYIGFNQIRYNGVHGTSAGVRIEGATSLRNATTQNSITQNTGLGIQLVGGNNNQAAPTITSATCSSIEGLTCPNCSVEIYSDTENEGAVYEKTITATSTGAFGAMATEYAGMFSGPYVTAIAFNGSNSSQFSLPVYVGACKSIFLPLIFK